jgi:phage terminase large subunit-like protein
MAKLKKDTRLTTKENLFDYADLVESGKIIVNIPVRLAIERFRKDFEREDLRFNYDKVLTICEFIQDFHLLEDFHDQRFILEPWQKFIIANIYGWEKYNPKKKRWQRRYQQAYIEVGRKNAKSVLAAVLQLVNLILDGVQGAQVVLAATSLSQAKLAFRMCSAFSKQLDYTGKWLKRLRDTITYDHTDSLLKVVPNAPERLDGLNVSSSIIDEYHAHVTDELKNVIVSSQGSRKNPLTIVITTAGLNIEVPCYQERETNIEVLKGNLEQDDTFILIYGCDDDDDPMKSEEDALRCMAKANPNLDVSVDSDFVMAAWRRAKNNPSYLNELLTKHFNKWLTRSQVWIDQNQIKKKISPKKLKISDYDPEEWSCFAGVDLSETKDMTSAVFLMKKIDEPIYHFIPFFFIPENAESGRIKKLYKRWERMGEVIVTQGNIVDYKTITEIFNKVSEHIEIQRIGYDPYNSRSWAIEMTELGYPLEPVFQRMGVFNAPTKELERLIWGAAEVVLSKSEPFQFSFNNCELKYDHVSNCMPVKRRNNKNMKIDGAMAAIMSLEMYLKDNDPEPDPSIYEIPA